MKPTTTAKPYGGRKKPSTGGSSRFGSKTGGSSFHRSNNNDDFGGRGLRKKTNRFYSVFPEKSNFIDHKDVDRLSKFITEKGKILPRRITALTAKQQRILTRAIKRSRQAGLMSFQAA